MKQLVIAEKPSVARDIARVLGCTGKSSTFIEGDNYIVTWALGHLVTLAEPEEYNAGYKKWSLEDLPMLPEQWKLVVIPQTARQFKAVKEQIFRKDVSQIIIATDAGREGELVARWILEKAGNRKPLKRLWISSVTDKAIRQGFEALRPGKDYEPLYHAAVSRAQADWLVGINATRALTCKYNAQLSCGRVQTPTLAMIAAREEEIRSFVPESYYGIRIVTPCAVFTWKDKNSGSTNTFQKERALKLLDLAKNNIGSCSLTVTSVSRKTRKSFSPPLYDLTSLQRDADQKFGFSAKQTLNIMQRLYETHKLLTYPRTDSRYITSDMTDTLKERLQACAAGPYRKPALKLAGLSFSSDRSFVNDKKVTDHHAIIPTEEFVRLEELDAEERKIYDMVVRRFLAVLSPPCEYQETEAEALLGEEIFYTKENVIIKTGWKEISEDRPEDDAADSFPCSSRKSSSGILSLKAGKKLQINSASVTEGKTVPPAYFTEGTLISAMEAPAKYLPEKSRLLLRTLNETGGLGTVATRADIIEKLFSGFLIEKKEKEIHMTSKGRQLLSLVPADLKSPELTAHWELRLKAIAQGTENRKIFMTEIAAYTESLIRQVKDSDGTFRHNNLTSHKCPLCGKRMLEVKGKHGKLLICQDRECNYRETVSRRTNARCPICHKKMELVGKEEGRRFVCSCGYKEKLRSFEARKKKEGKRGNRRDIINYMKKQEKETDAPLNNAFADALQRLNDNVK